MQNLDRLGIIAGLVDELDIVEQINQHLGEGPRGRISPGVAAKAMILNGLGLVVVPMYLFEQLFAGEATEHLRLSKSAHCAHLDSTLFAVEGDYLELEVTGSAAPAPISITYGYSPDRRPDLKQFVMNLVYWTDGDIAHASGKQGDRITLGGGRSLFCFHQYVRYCNN